MIYYLYLVFVVQYNDMAQGKLQLVSADDLRNEILSIDFCCTVDSDLDNLVVAVDPNVTLPSIVNTFNVAKDFNYNL